MEKLQKELDQLQTRLHEETTGRARDNAQAEANARDLRKQLQSEKQAKQASRFRLLVCEGSITFFSH